MDIDTHVAPKERVYYLSSVDILTSFNDVAFDLRTVQTKESAFVVSAQSHERS